MPIKPENRKLYPDNWNEISKNKIAQAGYKCEICGVDQYAVGIRLGEKFIPALGCEGVGLNYYENRRLTYKEARAVAKHLSLEDGEKYMVIVLTVMHLDHDPTNNDPSNHKAGCQRCHLMYDMPERIRSIKSRKYLGNISLIL